MRKNTVVSHVQKQLNCPWLVVGWVVFVLCLLLFSNGYAADTGADHPVVTTAAGKLKGFVHPEKGIVTFKGIHYGEDTSGIWRFKPPRPVAAWEGVKDALEYGATCPQTGLLGGGPFQSEDCLVLNVFTPGLDGKRPVMVWLHGGGFSSGSGSQAGYDGTALAKRGDVVVVTLNHRLNIFGYLGLAEIAGKAFAGSGMAGMLDIELALKWVRDNIKAFGGDANNVTIFGESGGGAKVSTLLAMPSSKGLFHKGIIQSGPGIRGVPMDKGTEMAKNIMENFGVTDVGKLQEMPFEELLKKAFPSESTDLASSMRFAPVVDGAYLPAHPFEPVAAPTGKDIPIIIGSNRDEALLFLQNDAIRDKMTEEELMTRVKPLLGDQAEGIIDAYKKSRPGATPWDLFIAVSSERFRLGSIILAERKIAAGGAPVYMYMFDFEVSDRFKAAHAMEIAFVFNHASARSPERKDVANLETLMSEAWIAFARTGNPNRSGAPEWPAYTLPGRATMVFNAESKVVNDPRGEEWKAWKDVDLTKLR